ncbi:MAG TPA: hypothetical protein DDW65_19150 [Firmicutes bacterium]|jgi:hypothetical protein|nr:hypothetical protein [Bacillota bacterium]
MAFEAITIRRAEPKDRDGIWHLLHAQCKGWSEEQIDENLPNLLLLIKQDKILAVLFGKLTAGKTEVIWIVIHPLYPEEELKQTLVHGLLGSQYPARNDPKASDIGGLLINPVV